MKAFVTGSQKYGSPTRDSDVDLVVLVSHEDLAILKELCDSDDRDKLTVAGPSDSGPQFRGGPSASLRFGRLNLLCVTDLIAYAVWLQGTQDLKVEADAFSPPSRAVAIKFFESLRRACGLYDRRPTVVEVAEEVSQWKTGTRVKFALRGVHRRGTVFGVDVREQVCTVSGDDDNEYSVPWSDLEADSPAPKSSRRSIDDPFD